MTTAPTRGSCSARSLARSREGGSALLPHLTSSRLASPRHASHRLASFAHRRSLHRLAPGIPRGCVTHSIRASIARGCRRWQPSLSLSLSFPLSLPSRPVVVPSRYRADYRAGIAKSLPRCRREPWRSVLVAVGRVQRNEHAAGRATLLFLGVVYFLGTTLASRVASLARLASAALRRKP